MIHPDDPAHEAFVRALELAALQVGGDLRLFSPNDFDPETVALFKDKAVQHIAVTVTSQIHYLAIGYYIGQLSKEFPEISHSKTTLGVARFVPLDRRYYSYWVYLTGHEGE